MKKILFCLTLCSFLFSVVSFGYASQEEKLIWDDSWPKTIRIGTGTVGGGAYMGGTAIANVLKAEFPQLEVIVEQTNSSVQNLFLLENGEIEIGACSLDCDYDALTGAKGSEFEGEKFTGFRAFMPRGPAPELFVTLKKSGITNVREITGKFSAGSYGSALSVYVPKVFKFFGVNAKIINLPTADAVQALQNGVISGFCLGHPNTAVVELAMTTDVNIFGLTGEDAIKFTKAYPEYAYPLVVPAGYYKGQDEALEIVGLQLTWNVRADLPVDMVYTMLKAWHKHQDIVKNTWPELLETQGTNPDYMKTISKISPVHEGAIRYYTELGVYLDENGGSIAK